MPSPNWSQPLPRPIIIPEVMQLATLGDVRVLFDKHLPAEYRAKFGWRQLATLLRRAAQGHEDAAEVATACNSSYRSSTCPTVSCSLKAINL